MTLSVRTRSPTQGYEVIPQTPSNYRERPLPSYSRSPDPLPAQPGGTKQHALPSPPATSFSSAEPAVRWRKSTVFPARPGWYMAQNPARLDPDHVLIPGQDGRAGGRSVGGDSAGRGVDGVERTGAGELRHGVGSGLATGGDATGREARGSARHAGEPDEAVRRLTAGGVTPKPAPAPGPAPSPLLATSFPGQVDAQAGPSRPTSSPATPAQGSGLAHEELRRKRKWAVLGYSPEEVREMESRAVGLHLSLALDQAATLFPDAPSRFISHADAVDRLLPWHVWQIHDEELEGYEGGAQDVKGKAGARAREEQEIAEAGDLLRRIGAVQDRFAKVRRREGEHPSDLTSLIHLIIQSTAATRNEVSELSTRLRAAKDAQSRQEAEARRLSDEARKAQERSGIGAQAKGSVMNGNGSRTGSGARGSVANSAAPTTAGTLSSRSPARAPAHGRTVAQAGAESTPFTNGSAAQSPVPQVPPSPRIPGTPATLTPSTRGRPRGSRGRGRGGLREAVLTHASTPTSNGTARGSGSGSGPSSTVSTVSSPRSSATGSPLPSPPIGRTNMASGTAAAGAGSTQGPIVVSLPAAKVAALTALGLEMAAISNDKSTSKSAVKLVRRSADEQTVVLSIDLALCDKAQIAGLAKIFNVASAQNGQVVSTNK